METRRRARSQGQLRHLEKTRSRQSTHATRAFLRAMAEGPEPFALSELGCRGFVRIVTNPKIWDEATPLNDAPQLEHGCELVTADADFARFAGSRA